MAPISKSRNFHVSKGLSPERKQFIDQLVETVRNKIAYHKPPLELVQIEIGIPEIQICEVPHSPVATEIFYLDQTRNIAQINIRAKDITQNKILYTCHALGHYFLHPKENCACRLDFYGEAAGGEAEATYFAETLMMPNGLVTEMFRNLAGDYDPVYKLAKCFSVKRQLMEDRLSSLQLI